MTILIILTSCFLLLALLCNFLAGRFNAIMDALKHFPTQSVFAAKAQKVKTVFGINSQYWYNQNGKDYLGKYEDYKPMKQKRKWNVLGIKIHIVQISDAWHWFKMWSVAMEKLDGTFIAFASVCAFALLWIDNSFTIDYTLLIIAVGLICYFWLAGFTWIVSFNKHYEEWLRL